MQKWQRVSFIILKVLSSSLTGRSSKKIFSFAFYRIVNYQKIRKKTRKIYNQLTRSEPNSLLLIQININPLQISDFPAVVQKKGDKCKRRSHENSSLEF